MAGAMPPPAHIREDRGAEVLRVQVGERALALFADAPRGVAYVEDECVSHDAGPYGTMWRRRASDSGQPAGGERQGSAIVEGWS